MSKPRPILDAVKAIGMYAFVILILYPACILTFYGVMWIVFGVLFNHPYER